MPKLLPSQTKSLELLIHLTSYSDLIVLVSGPQGSGKTILANALLATRSSNEALLLKASELQPDYEDGNIFLYLGVFETLFPPALGGKPEVGKAHFEEAIARSEGKNLLAKVMFAEQYARLVFNRELHDELLTQVLDAEPNHPGFTLMNIVAQEQAKELMDSADEYF